MLCSLGLCYDSKRDDCCTTSFPGDLPRYLFPGAVRTKRPPHTFDQVRSRQQVFYVGRRIELSRSRQVQQTMILSPALVPLLQQKIMSYADLDGVPILWATGLCGHFREGEVAIESGVTHKVQYLTILASTLEHDHKEFHC